MTLPPLNSALTALGTYRAARSLIPASIRLDGNEGRALPDSAMAVLRELGPEVVQRYPNKAPLEARLAARFSLDPECLTVTSGADDALDRIARAWVGHGRTLVLPAPSFEMIPRFVAIAGGSTIEVPWWDEPLNVRSVLDAVVDTTSVIAVVTPNNPTGLTATPEQLEEIIAGAAGKLVVVDLAYVEFADVDPTPVLLRHNNVVVTRTLSKAWSCAGARVGFAMAKNPAIIRALRDAGGPYPVGALSLVLAEEWLATGDAHVAASKAQVRQERVQLDRLIDSLGGAPLPSQANFVCARYPDVGWVHDALASVDIAIRAFTDKPALAGYARISCPQDEAIFAVLQDSLTTALQPKRVLVGVPDAEGDFGRERLDMEAFDRVQRAGSIVLSDAPETLRRARDAGWVSVGWGADVEAFQRAGAATAVASAAQFRELVGRKHT